MERKSPGWLSNELLRLVDHKRAVREESRACVHVWEWECKQKRKTLSLCIFVCKCVCDREKTQKEALPQVGLVNGSASLRLKRTRHYKSRVVTEHYRSAHCLRKTLQRHASKRENASLSFTFIHKQLHTLYMWLVCVCPRVDKEGREGGTCFLSMPEFERVKK